MSLIHSLAKLRQNIEEILKTDELIYGDIHYIINVFCKNVLKLATLYPRLELHWLTLLVPRADISAFAPRVKSAATRYIGSSVDHN
jgi:hypothetical protein